MRIQPGDIAPDFTADTTMGPIEFHEWIGDSWALLLAYPRAVTPMCTAELREVVRFRPLFKRRNCKIIALSADSIADHRQWAQDIEAATGRAPNFPLIGDSDRAIARHYAATPVSAGDETMDRANADDATLRSMVIIGPDKRVKLMLAAPVEVGRNVEELLRVIDSLQRDVEHNVAAPVN